MKVAGIVAEYNPFHTGHAFQIEQTRLRLGEECAVVAVMSGNWVQQADCAIADKWTRARLALMGGADLVLELPTVWACSSAESFARGAINILDACGVVDALSFGSECGDIEGLNRVAQCLDGPEYENRVRALVNDGATFAACRQQAVEELLGVELGGLLSRPNNNLGVEYIRALNDLNSGIEPMTVLRKGAAHNSTGQTARFVSATQIRMELAEGNWDAAQPYLPEGGRALLEGHTVAQTGLVHVERAILARLRTMTAQDWERLPDCGLTEGLPNRLERAGKTCISVDDFFEQVKTKRYTRARLNRLVLWAWLGLTAADVPYAPPYIRVLGFNERGREVLRQMKARASLPILTKPAHARVLDETGRKLFELEARCTDLYDLCFETIPAPGREWNTDPVILL
ncbi:MAG: nucleotidyltransferase family protein [Ruminococcaceae bacterium]|nr:nucleotidyltransferase family protein [Oscillospiraceae bacterium]